MSLQDNIEATRMRTQQRRDSFALSAPPVPDWYMPAPTRESYDAWIDGAGKKAVNELKSRADSGGIREYQRRDRLTHEEIRTAVKKAYAEYAEKKDAEIRDIIAMRTFSWRVYFADELIAALDKDRVQQNCRTCKHESTERHHAPCDVCLYEGGRSGRLPKWEPNP